MIDKRKVAAMIVQNVGTDYIAAAVGCDASYISQLREDPEVLALMQEKASELSLEDANFDKKLNDTQAEALRIISDRLPFANLNVALNVFRTLNGAKKRTAEAATDGSNHLHVHLTLPAAIAMKYLKDDSNQIIEVEGRTMVTATPKSIDELLAARNDPKHGKNVPQVTQVDKAVAMLGGLTPAVRERAVPRAAKRSPIPLVSDL